MLYKTRQEMRLTKKNLFLSSYISFIALCENTHKHKTQKCVQTPQMPFFVVVQSLSHVWLFWDVMDCSPPGSSVHDFPGKNTEMGCHFLLQGIFLTQGSNLHLLAGEFLITEPPEKPKCHLFISIFVYTK